VGESELEDIRQELQSTGYVKKSTNRRQQRALPKSKPYHYRSSDGIDIFVGKNAAQNERLTGDARPNEMWLHAKDMPGSHVIIKAEGNIPDATLSDAATLAAWYSKGQHSSMVPIDYTLKRYVKKIPGGATGMVTYTNQKTAYMTVTEADVRKIQLVEGGDLTTQHHSPVGGWLGPPAAAAVTTCKGMCMLAAPCGQCVRVGAGGASPSPTKI